jgi:hypothetical protein
MLKYEVREKIVINASKKEALEFIADFQNWPSWSPWLIMEPGCKLTYSDNQKTVGAHYHWSGDLVGAGSMELLAKTGSDLHMGLKFLKPFKSQADVSFEFVELDDATEVTWVMNSQVPWFLFFLRSMFAKMIAMDYDRGLKMLKSKLETGEVASHLELHDNVHLEETHYIALSAGATIEDLGPVMRDHIEELGQVIEQHNLVTNGPIFAIYNKMDMKTSFSEFKTCAPITSKIDLPAPFVVETLPESDFYGVTHTGSYLFLGNAWSMVMSAARHYKVGVKRKPMGIERYIDSPMETDDKNLKSQILLFKK